MRHLPLAGGFYAINLFGVIFAKGPLSVVDINHERIHTAQMRELGYVGFYLWYIVEWTCLVARYRHPVKAYYHIRFEQEAYRHQTDLLYLSHRRHYHYT